MCSTRRRGRTTAAPPAEMQRSSRRHPDRSNQSGPADMLTVSTQNMQRLSNLQSSSTSLQPCFSGFRQTSLSMPGALPWLSGLMSCEYFPVNIYMNILINMHVNIYNEYLWWNRDILRTNFFLQKDINILKKIFFWIFNSNLNIINVYSH